MPMSTTCKFRGEVISVERALKLKLELSTEERKEFFCVFEGCGQVVSPHRQSKNGNQGAHFEHIPSDGGRNKKCPFSDVKASRRR